DAAARHGARGLSDDSHVEGSASPATGAAAVSRMQGRGGRARGADRAVRHDPIGASKNDPAVAPGGAPRVPRPALSPAGGGRRVRGADASNRWFDLRGGRRYRNRAGGGE